MRKQKRMQLGSLFLVSAMVCLPPGVYFLFGGETSVSRKSMSGSIVNLSHDSAVSAVQQLQQLKPANFNINVVSNGLSSIVMTDNMTDDEADIYYFEFIQHIDVNCGETMRIGNAADGGWNACVARMFQLRKPCLVYSFGINYDFSFDDAVSKQFGCTVRSFDPSMANAVTHRRDENIWFYKLGISGSDTVSPEGWTLKTLRSLVNMFNDSGKTIDYLKLDVEDSEWASLEAMYQSDILSRVKQLGMEIHVYPFMLTNAKAFYVRWKMLKRLEEFGFRRWYWHLNEIPVYQYNGRRRSCCYEMIYINMNYVTDNVNKSSNF